MVRKCRIKPWKSFISTSVLRSVSFSRWRDLPSSREMRLRRSLLSDGPHGNCAGLQRGDDQRGHKHDRREARGPSMKYSIIVKEE